jgi:type IV secretory pathway TraG/TraD family ATPase VirD4
MRLPGPVKDAADRITRPGEMLVFVAGHPVIRGQQILYFNDPAFSVRSQIPPPKQSATVRRGFRLPTADEIEPPPADTVEPKPSTTEAPTETASPTKPAMEVFKCP